MWDFFLSVNIYYYMKNIIRKILKESAEQPKRLFKYVEHSLSNFDDNVEEVIEDLEDNLGLTKLESYTILFEYFIHIGVDPLKMTDFDDVSYYFGGDESVSILSNSGWLDKYLKDKTSFPRDFRDITEVGDGERFLLKLDDWEEFSCLFDERNLSSKILQQDSAELYGWFEVDYENDIVDNLDDKSKNHIQEYVKEKGFIGKPISDNQYDISFEGDNTVLTEEMVNDIDTLLELIGEDDLFFDLRIELENFYRWSYESAGESEIFNKLRSEIEGFFGNKPYWEDNKLYLDVTTVFYDSLVRFLECEGKMPGNEHNYFLTVVCETLACEGDELMSPDMNYFYPDSRLVASDFNENVRDNI